MTWLSYDLFRQFPTRYPPATHFDGRYCACTPSRFREALLGDTRKNGKSARGTERRCYPGKTPATLQAQTVFRSDSSERAPRSYDKKPPILTYVPAPGCGDKITPNPVLTRQQSRGVRDAVLQPELHRTAPPQTDCVPLARIPNPDWEDPGLLAYRCETGSCTLTYSPARSGPAHAGALFCRERPTAAHRVAGGSC